MEELSLHILDIVENSVSAGATLVEIRIEYRFGEKPWLTITVRDNGRGMSPEVAGRVSDPFYTTRTTRKVGLGQPCSVRQRNWQGGASGCGPSRARAQKSLPSSIRCIWTRCPWGIWAALMECWSRPVPGVELVLHAVCDGREFTADTRQFREILGDVPLDTPEVIAFLTEFVRENFAEILRGSPLA